MPHDQQQHSLHIPVVSVVIPCYRQAHFLGEAIESALAQTHRQIEIIVVDDGSPDNTAEVAARYVGVRYIRQENQGLSGARNTGLHASNGQYVVFLDADDRLVPNGVEQGLACFAGNAEWAFVSGHHRYIKADGSLLTEYPPEPIHDEPYYALLVRNYIGMHATVLYRRAIFDQVGAYNTALKSCEDYDLYLRIAQRFPVYRHDHMVAEYRQHNANMSGNAGQMLQTALAVLRGQRTYIQDKPHYIVACRAGVRFWRGYFLERLAQQARGDLRGRAWRQLTRDLILLARFTSQWAAALRMEIELTLAALWNKGPAQRTRA